MKNLKTAVVFTALLTAGLTSFAVATDNPAAMEETGAATAAEMAEGEIRKIDLEARKITIKHGEIKNLDMPGMTMVFQVKDLAILDKVKAGDKVHFRAEKAGGAIVVTDIQSAK